jgi:hypothetical protein
MEVVAMRFFNIAVLLALVLITACTPEFARQKTIELGGQTRLLDSVDIQRSNQRVLMKQAQVCLVSDLDADRASIILTTMQSAFIGYFAAVGIEHEPMDYLRAMTTAACPGAEYLFFVQPLGQASCINDDTKVCDQPHRFVITIVSRGDQSVSDRITLTAKKSFIPRNSSDEVYLRKVFEQLAATLTGVAVN